MKKYWINENIFWIDGNNYPNYNYFEDFKTRGLEFNGSLNFNDIYNLDVVIKSKNVVYFSIEVDGFTYYYFVNDINKIVSGGYEYSLKLDVYTTYLLKWFKENENTQFLLTRNKKWNEDALSFEDEYLRNINLNGTYKKYDNDFVFEEEFGNRYYKGWMCKYKDTGTLEPLRIIYETWLQISRPSFNSSEKNNWTNYLIVSDNNDWLIIPIMYETVFETNRTGNNLKLENDKFSLNELVKSTEYANKIYGVYRGVNVLTLFKEEYAAVTIKELNYRDRFGVMKHNILTLDSNNLDVSDLMLYKNVNVNFDNEITYNLETINHPYLYKYIPVRYGNNDMDLSQFYTDNGEFKLSGRFIFNGNFTFYYNNKFVDYTSNFIDFGYQLPLYTDTYNQYIASSYNSVNTGLNIAKRKSMWGAIGGSLDSLWQVPSGFGDIISMFGNLGKSVSSNINAFRDYKSQLNAKFKDAYNTNGGKIAPSNINDTLAMFYYDYADKDLTANLNQHEGIEIFDVNSTWIKSVNNYLFLNGFKYNNYSNLVYDDKYDCFNYVFDIEDINNKFSNTYEEMIKNGVVPSTPNKIKDELLNMLISGVRIWKNKPEIKTM